MNQETFNDKFSMETLERRSQEVSLGENARSGEGKISSAGSRGAFLTDEDSIGRVVEGLHIRTNADGFKLGREASEVEKLLFKRSRGDLYGTFLETYLPALDPKLVLKWKGAYEAFSSLLPLDDDPLTLPELELLRLGGIFRLSQSAHDAPRKAALALARQGIVVTDEIAQSLLRGNGPKTPLARRRKTTISVSSGIVDVRITGSDVPKALAEALVNLKRSAEQQAST